MAFSARSQPTVQWAYGLSNGEGKDVHVDQNGFVYYAGAIESQADFNPALAINYLNSTGGSMDAVVAKYDSAGNYVWGFSVGGNNVEVANAIATDNAGNVYVLGEYNSITDFNPGAGTAYLTHSGGSDIFLAKYNSSGTFVWVKKIGGATDDQGRDVIIDSNQDIIITGKFEGTVDFNPNAGTNNLTSGSPGMIYVAKYDANGNYIWAFNIGANSNGEERGNALALDTADNIYVAGKFEDIGDFDPGAGTLTFGTAPNNFDGFIGKYDPAGNLIWAFPIGGNGIQEITCVGIDNSNQLYIAGSYAGFNIDFDPGAAFANIPGPVNAMGLFISRYDLNADFQRVFGFGSMGSNGIEGMDFDTAGNIYISGKCHGVQDFDPHATNVLNLGSTGSYDGVIVEYDSTGNILWGHSMGNAYPDACNALVCTANGFVVAGDMFNVVDFEPGTLAYDVFTPETFLAKYYYCAGTPPAPQSIIGPPSPLCQGSGGTYSVITGGNTYAYVWTFPAGWSTVAGTTNATTIDNGPSAAGSGIITVYAQSGCGNSPSLSFPVTVIGYVSQPDTIYGPIDVCVGSTNIVYSVPVDTNATSYTWTFPSGWTHTTGTNSVTGTPGNTGNISVKAVNSCGQSISQLLSVFVHPLPTVSFSLPVDTLCLNSGLYSLTGGTPIGGIYTGTGVSGGMFSPLNAGIGLHTINYAYSDAFQCSNNATDVVYVDICSGVSEIEEPNIEVYPNPTSEIIYVSALNTIDHVTVFNSCGQKFTSTLINAKEFNLNISGYPSGMYVMVFKSGGTFISRKILVTKL